LRQPPGAAGGIRAAYERVPNPFVLAAAAIKSSTRHSG
jgi:hypothetical protein